LIGIEAEIAKGYAAFKSGDLEAARRILEVVPHKRAKQLVAEIDIAIARSLTKSKQS